MNFLTNQIGKHEQMLTIKDVARICNVSAQTISRNIKKGDLTAYQISGSYRITKEQLNEFLNKKKTA